MSSYSKEIPYFREDELECSCCGQLVMDMALAVYLPVLRHEWNSALNLSSCCRCTAHNDAEGGHPRSMHLIKNPRWDTSGSAGVDVKWRMWPIDTKKKFAQFCWARGWSVGLHDGFCHIDRRVNAGLTQAVYTYGSGWSKQFSKEDVITG